MSKYSEARKLYVNNRVKEAYVLYEKGLEEGDVKCAYGVALCLKRGNGVEQDETRADKLFAEYFAPIKALADKGDAEAEYVISCYYDDGYYVKEDKAIAIEWLKKAAEHGDVVSQFALACFYEAGNGVERDFGKAFAWYKRAAEQGDEDAQFSLALCYYDGVVVEQDFEKVREWCEKAAAQGNSAAREFLANKKF